MATPPGPNPAAQTLQPGTVLFGEYEILGTIGAGGMGAVYQARHRSLGGLRAIKVIRTDAGLGQSAEDMFVREAKTLIDIHHDAIVHCHDLLRNEWGLFLIMELVEGPSLQRLLLRGPLPDDEWTVLKNRILQGLAVVHARGIIHRDISPANIILPGNAPEKAKLIDFGVAAPDEGKQTTNFSGNLSYASPEHFGLFGGRVDARSDLYSLGLVLAEATIGEALPMGHTFFEAKEMRKLAPQIPDYVAPDLRKVLQALLEPNPAKRAESAQAVLDGKLPEAATAAVVAPPVKEKDKGKGKDGGLCSPSASRPKRTGGSPSSLPPPPPASAWASASPSGCGTIPMCWPARPPGPSRPPSSRPPPSAPATPLRPRHLRRPSNCRSPCRPLPHPRPPPPRPPDPSPATRCWPSPKRSPATVGSARTATARPPASKP